ncbi:MAG: hypothetical protein GY765_22430 [bacterium]|nr:hypothetical protein [bacterium]
MRKKSLQLIICLIAVVIFVPSSLVGDEIKSLPGGKIIDKVECLKNPGQSYALYLPPGYDESRNWPILYAFDAGARSRIPLELFKEAAAKYGYIMVCSNNARNGPNGPIHEAMTAIWQDTRRRLAVDAKRIYATGFSGGARMASVFHVLTVNSCAGIIACGAGISPIIKKLEDLKSTFWYGIVGLEDMNYNEFLNLSKTFQKIGVRHYIDVIEAEHRWPPQEVCTRALEWMETEAAKKGTAPKDMVALQALYQKALSRAHNLELENKIYYAADAFKAAHTLFDGLLDTSHAKEKETKLTASPQSIAFKKAETARNKTEADCTKIMLQTIYFIQHPEKVPGGKKLRLSDFFRELKIDAMLRDSRKHKDYYQRCLSRRILSELSIQTSTKGQEYMAKKDTAKAILLLEIANKSGTGNRFNFLVKYNLACLYSLAKKKKKALKYLNEAVADGFKNRDHMEKDTDLDNIRKEKAFKELIASMATE